MARSVRWIVLLAAAVALSRCSCGGDEPCPSGQTDCRGACVVLGSDLQNCGACGNACATGASCDAGTCRCPAGQEVCRGACVDPASYTNNDADCGACGISCGPGTCVGTACDCTGFIACDGQVPRCVDGLNDPQHCGTDASACTNDCPLANEACVGGTCTCAAPFPNQCTSACVNFASDASNCLGCGNTCAAGASCTPTGCLCPDGESVCGTAPGVCVNESTDEANCGQCGYTCPAGVSCTSGRCPCPAQTPLLCGTPGAGGRCCAGNGCCANDTCQTQHANGVGGSYFDCVAAGTYNVTQAEKAASSWQPQGQAFPGVAVECPGCIGWVTPQGTSPAFCGTWCYAGPLTGKVVVVQSLVCTCAGINPGTWN